MITYQDIQQAAQLLSSVVHDTPLLTSKAFDERTGNEVFLKGENFQRIGAFKIRGAYNKIARLAPEELSRGVIAHSSGNHAQGVALAARLLGTRATVVMPGNSLPNKVAATKQYGAEVVFCEDSLDARIALAAELQNTHGYTLVPPYDDDHIIAGQGTMMPEIARLVKDLDYLFCPIGGGGMIAGNAIAAKHLFPHIKVIGVETEPANDCQQTFRTGAIVSIQPPVTIADGMRNQRIGARNFEIIMKYVDDVVTVTDSEVIEMMRFFLERMKVVAEPTGAVAPAAIYFNKLNLTGKKICAIISGGNVSLDLLKTWL